MKITAADMHEILGYLRNPVGKDGELPKELKERISHLNMLMIEDPYFEEMVRTSITMTLIQCVTKGDTEPQEIYDKMTQMGVLVGMSIGLQLGLREAGLELGIAGSTSTPDKEPW